MKKNRKYLTISSIICLIPMIVSIFLYNKIPNEIPVHFNFNGEVDAYGSKLLVCIIFPIILCIVNIIFMGILNSDPKRDNQNNSLRVIFMFIIPLLSLIIVSTSIFISLGMFIDIRFIIILCLSLLFLVVGNYLPKCRQNYTMGIRLPWTLNNSDNWIRTHRFAGNIWVICGILNLILGIFFIKLAVYFFLPSVLIVVILPMIYSYILYKKQKNT